MKFRFTLACLALAAVVSYTGCDKIKPILHRFSKPTPTATPVPATPTPATPTPSTPTPTPKPTANHDASVIVLCYHRIEDIKNGMCMKPEEFEKEMQAIKDAGFTVIPMQDFLAWRRDEKQIPTKSALITIDDGYVSAYEAGWPILKKFGYPFTMFVYIQYISSGGKSITWEQLAEMRDAGVEIGSHSFTHQNLKCRSAKAKADAQRLGGLDPWLNREIVESKKVLEDHLGIKVSTFCYPEGSYDEKAREIVKQAGYEAAFVTYGQRNTFSSPANDIIGRYAIESNKPKTFIDALAMIGGGMGPGTYASAAAAAPVTPTAATPVASALHPVPAENSTVSDPKPLIKAVLTSFGAPEADSVQMRISGFGLVPAKYDAATQTLSFQPTTQPLRDKDYTVIVSGKADGKRFEARWSFKFDPAKK